MISKNMLLVLIILLASFLRIPFLDIYPAGFNADEAAIGYNAYSLISTGKDEYGASWPLSFKSFGDYKPGLYFYFVIPFIASLGLNEWAVRLPSALFGIGTVILIYFLAKEIFVSRLVGFLSSFLLAISPWHIHFSRGGWETNVATFFITLGIYLFLRGFHNINLMFVSLVSFLTSMYVYQSPRLIIPVLLLSLLFIYFRNLKYLFLKENPKKTFLLVTILIILSLPLIMQFTSTSATSRFSGLFFIYDPGSILRVNELRGEHNEKYVLTSILHNKLTAYGPEFLGHYLDHFRPDFLFINGDSIIRNRVPETGQFYIVEALFLIFGIVLLIHSKVAHKSLLLAWVLISPLASSVTFQTPNALRPLSLVVPMTLIIGYGLANLTKLFRGRLVIVLVVVFLILSFEFIHYIESYYIHYPKRYPLAWEYGFKEMTSKLEKYEKNYENIIITDKYDQPYILVLFYKKYDPAKYQPQANLSPRDKFNFGTVRNFDKYSFRHINWPEDSKITKSLIIGTREEIPENVNIIDKVVFPDDQSAFLFTEGAK